MIWLDGLDLPNFAHFPVHFVEHFDKPRYPAEDVDTSNSPIVFPWSRMKSSLDAAEGKWATKPYLKEDGREGMLGYLPSIFGSYHHHHLHTSSSFLLTYLYTVSRIIGGSAERLGKSSTSPLIRETSSSVYHIIQGSGSTTINGNSYSWKKGDTFCIPAWHQYQHTADESQQVYLYRFDDKPMLKALGFYRVEGIDTETLVSD